MAKYMRKLKILHAVQFRGVGWYEKHDKSYPEDACLCNSVEVSPGSPHHHIHTRIGPVRLSVDDYIATEESGEKHIISKDFFEKNYEQVVDARCPKCGGENVSMILSLWQCLNSECNHSWEKSLEDTMKADLVNERE